MPTRTRKPVSMSADPEPQPMVPIILTDDIEDPPVPPGTTDEADPYPDSPQGQNAPTATPGGSTVPSLPEGLLPLAHGFCQYLQAKLDKELTDSGIKMARVVDTTITAMADYTKGVLACNEHASYQISDALLKVLERGFTISGAPYTATVTALNADGFAVTLTIHKHESSSLVEELQRLLPWMRAQGFTSASVEGHVV